MVTIVDVNGCSTIESVTIAPGKQLISEIIQQVDTLTAVVSGGTAPYAFQWSNGAITARIFPKTSGTYTVTITDADGCSTTRVYSFIYTASEIIPEFKGNIYPSPARNELFIVFSQPAGDYTISLYDLNGVQMLNTMTSFISTSSTIDVSTLVPGVYVLKISGSGMHYCTKVMKM